MSPVVLVAPSWPAGLQVRRRLAERREGRAVVGLRVVTPARLGLMLAADELARHGWEDLPAGGLLALARRAAAEAGAYFAPVVDRPHFGAVAASTISFLRSHAVSPGSLDAMAARAQEQERPRWRALASVYTAVCQELAPAGEWPSRGRWTDLAARWWAAVRVVERGEAGRRLPCGARVVLWGDEGLFEPGHLWRRLAAGLLSPSSGVLAERIDLAPLDGGAGAPGEPWTIGADALWAADEVKEAERAAAVVLDEAARGTPLYRMAVVVREQGTLHRHVVQALGRAGIPAYATAETLLLSPPGRALASWLALVEDELPRNRTMEWLASAAIRPSWLDLEPGQWAPLQWARISAEAGVVAGFDSWEARLEAAVSRAQARVEGEEGIQDAGHGRTPGGEEAGAREAWRSFGAMGANLLRRAREWPRVATWSEFAEVAAGFVEGALLEEDDTPAVQEVAGAVRRLGALDRLCGGAPVRLGEFREMVAFVLGAARAQAGGGFEQGRIAVLDARQAAGCHFDVVVVMGLNDPGWPRRPGRAPLLGEADLEALGVLGAGAMREWQMQREARLFATAALAAGRRLVVSWSTAEAVTGRERALSPLLARLELRTAGQGQGLAEATSLALDEVGFDVALAARAISRAQAWPADALRRLEAYLARRYPLAAAGATARSARRSPRLTEWDGAAGSVTNGDVVFTSPTGLERLARCPRLFFFERKLRIAELADPEASEGLEGMARGSVAHRALQLFFQRWQREHPPGPGEATGERPAGVEPAWEAWLQEAVDQAMEEHAADVAALPGVARIQGELLFQAIRRFLQQELAAIAAGPWSPRGFEVEVTLPEVALDGGRRMRLAGRLDRVDRRSAAPGARVIDYKTFLPSRLPSPGKLQGGRSLQLPLYLWAASHMTRLEPQACRSELVFIDDDGSPLPVTLEGSAWQEIEPALRRVLQALGSLLADGRFPPFPESEQVCHRCRFYAICGPDGVRDAGRKQSEPALALLAALREEVR